jgi:uncharacterized membrane protein YphA (DoxX/SURF4 family)
MKIALQHNSGMIEPGFRCRRRPEKSQAMFMKNLSVLGGALLIAYFGAGPFSLHARFESHSDKSR